MAFQRSQLRVYRPLDTAPMSSRVKKKTGGGMPAPVRLRVANPRQGDFAKPD